MNGPNPMVVLVDPAELVALRRTAAAATAFVELLDLRRTAGRVNVPTRELNLLRSILKEK